MSATRPLVVVSERLGAIGPEEERIAQAGAELRSVALWSHEEIAANAGDAEIVLLGAVEPFDGRALSSLPRCRAVVRRGVGVDNVEVGAATRLGILVANVPDASVEEVSDHALALLFAIERRIVPLDRAVHAGEWQRDPKAIGTVRNGIRRLSELTLGVVGFGRIGRALARKAAGAYGRMLVADPIAPAAAVREASAELVPLDELLGTADHITLHAPLEAGTRHLIGPDSIARLRPGVVIVNTARGGLIDEAALLAGLREGRIAAAGLDVTEHEPLPEGDPLLTAAGVVLTAHSAASSATASDELARRSVDAVVAILEGRQPASIVNREVLEVAALRAAGLRPPG